MFNSKNNGKKVLKDIWLILLFMTIVLWSVLNEQNDPTSDIRIIT